MKKIIYLLVLVFTITLVNTSCEKESNEPNVPPISIDSTLAQKYPEWRNLTWVSTTFNGTSVNYPKYYFTINNNVITETYIKSNDITSKTNYIKLSLINNNLIKLTTIDGSEIFYSFEKINNNIIITAGNYKYKLLIN